MMFFTGAAMNIPAAVAMISVAFTDPVEKGRAYAIYSAAGAVGNVLGLVLGGVLTARLSWRWGTLVHTIELNIVFDIRSQSSISSLSLSSRSPLLRGLSCPHTPTIPQLRRSPSIGLECSASLSGLSYSCSQYQKAVMEVSFIPFLQANLKAN